jgi:hypothetical protein
VYPDLEEFWADIGAAYRKAIRPSLRRGLPLLCSSTTSASPICGRKGARELPQERRRPGYARVRLCRRDQWGPARAARRTSP